MTARRHIRSRDRKQAHDAELRRIAADLSARAPHLADELMEAAENQIADGPDFSRYRRGSRFMKPPKITLDRN